MQQRISLGENLIRSFGNSGKIIMAASMTYAMEPDTFSNINATLERTYIREFYNLKTSLDSGTLSKFTKRIGNYTKCINRSYKLRVK